MPSGNYHKDALEVFLVYSFCFSIAGALEELLLVLELPEEKPLDLLFIQGTSADPLDIIVTCELDPFKEGFGVFFCKILSSWVSEHALDGDSDNSFFLRGRKFPFPLTLIGVLFPEPSFLPARCALLALVIQKYNISLNVYKCL
jgi:hypothetical protein